MRKRLFIFAAATCFALSAFATPAFAGEPGLPDGPTIGSETYVQSEGNSEGNSNGNSNGNSDGNSNGNSDGNPNGNSDGNPNGNSDGNPNGNSDGDAKKDAPRSGSDDALPDEESYSDEEQANAGGSSSVVAMIGNTGYTKLQDAIDKACSDTTSSDATITLQRDLELNTEGLRFIGSDDSNVPWKKITLNADNHSLTLKNSGIYATHCEVTIKNCRALTVNAGTNPSDTPNISAVFFCPGTLILDNCKTVNITNVEPKEAGGSGLCIYNGGDLYIQNNTRFTVSGFMNGTPVMPGAEGEGGCSGIYIDSDENVNNDYKTITGQIVVSNNSTLTATNCFHNGITANPVNITVKGYSKIDVNHNNDGWAGYGGLGCYYGTLTVSDHSLVTAYNNTAWRFAVFVDGLDIDGTSKVNVTDNGNYPYGGTGIAISGKGILQSGAELTSSGNWGPGVQVYAYLDDNYNFISGGSLTVESGATLSSCKNYNYGLANGYKLNIMSGARVYLKENYSGGLDNYPYATAIADTGADLAITNNYGRGIKNGNSDPKHFGNKPSAVAKLNLNAGLITENNTGRASMPSSIGDLLDQNDYGGGIYNEYGTVSLSPLVKVYNNKAVKAGDDLYNDNKGGNSFTIIQLEPGAKWSVLDDDGCIIDDWYHDAEGEGNRWKATTAKNNTVTELPRGAALKAAHGINAPTPSPKPAEPTAAPIPTAAPTTAPTAAPTAAPTTAPADNTATAAPATPAPTARPTVTATPAPTAQASGVIPQTGDSSSPALFSILTLGSITALCVLQKRRKSK